MQDTWDTTQQRIRDWRERTDETGFCSGWELRRILSHSQFLPQIVHMALFRSPLREQVFSAEQHWAFGLDKLPEEVATQLLMEVVDTNMPKWFEEVAERDAQRLLKETREAVKRTASPTEGKHVSGALSEMAHVNLMLRHPQSTIVVFIQRPPEEDPAISENEA